IPNKKTLVIFKPFNISFGYARLDAVLYKKSFAEDVTIQTTKLELHFGSMINFISEEFLFNILVQEPIQNIKKLNNNNKKTKNCLSFEIYLTDLFILSF
ncbi:unnamed protein product, partial [Heterotrigona itama]